VSIPWILVVAALWATVALLGLILLGTLRRILPIVEQAERSLAADAARAGPGGLTDGTTVPPFTAVSVGGATYTELDLRDERTVVLFIGATCRACEPLIEGLENGFVPDLGVRLVTVVENADFARELARSAEVTVLIDELRSLALAFDSHIVPHAFVVEDGRVRSSGRPNTWDSVRLLVEAGEAEGGGGQFESAAAAAASDA
jgi:hypothetical protein